MRGGRRHITNDQVMRRALADPRVAFLQKPFNPEELSAKVREVLDEGPTLDSVREAQANGFALREGG